MTQVFREGPYRVYIYAHEGNEPPHVHVKRDGNDAKFWLLPVEVSWSRGFKPIEVRRIGRMLDRHAQELLKEWHERHGSRIPPRPPHSDHRGR